MGDQRDFDIMQGYSHVGWRRQPISRQLAQANEWRPNHLAMKHHAEARELSSSLSISAQTKTETAHPCHASLPPAKPFPPQTKQHYSSTSTASACGGQAESGVGGVGGILAWGDWARLEAEVEVDPTVSFKAVSINAGVGKPTAQPRIKSFYTPFDAQMDEVDSPAPPHPPMLPPVIEPTPLPRPSGTEDELENGLSPFFLIERINLFLPHGVVWGGEVRRFWWMKVRDWCRDRVAIPVQGRGQCL